jgi:DNA-binding LacI/PurR family transcriptional regulator
VRQPLRESGRQGAALLLRALAGDGVGPPARLPELEIVDRRTVSLPVS